MTSNERTYTIHLFNDGNVVHQYRVSAQDQTGDLSFGVDSGPYSLDPGAEQDVPLTVRAERRPLIGVPTFYPFETVVEQVDGSNVHRNSAHLRVTPRIPLWLLWLLPLFFACGALVNDWIPIAPPATMTATATVTATSSVTTTSTATLTPTSPAGTTVTATGTGTSTSTSTPTPTATATATPTPTNTPTPTPTPTSTPTPTQMLPIQPRTHPPLTISVSVNWRLDPADADSAIADVVISAEGGDGNYTYYRDDILQPGPTFSFYWRRCALNPVSFRVDSGDGQTARVGRAEVAPCPP